MKTNLTKRLAALGMVSICAIGVLTGCATAQTPSTNSNSNATSPSTQTPATPQATSPMGERRMITVDGNRYVFLNNGTALELTLEQIGNEISKQNEGTLFELKKYNPEFRMAFEYDDAFYIVENVGHTDDTPINISDYLKAADLKNHVVFADIFDHMGMNILSNLQKEDADKILDILATAQVAKLETKDHEAIAKAQSEGLSYLVEFTLEDHTVFQSYIIPSMNYVSIGDYTCTIENLEEQMGSYFEGLVASENIIYN